MKKLTLILALFSALMLYSIDSFAQSNQEKALQFLNTRTLSFDSGQVPQEVNDISVVLNSLKRSKVNYTHVVHAFLGDSIDPSAWMGSTCLSRGGGQAKPYIKYSIRFEKGITYLEVVLGNNGW